MLSDLYSDGAIQLSRDLRFAVLQGMCVGGSTVVNNAVCIKAAGRTCSIAGTSTDGLNAGLDLAKLNASVNHIDASSSTLPTGGTCHARWRLEVLAGCRGFGLQDQRAVVDANIVECLGCGYCNIGCKFGRSSRCSTPCCRGRRSSSTTADVVSIASATRSGSRWTGRRQGGALRARRGRQPIRVGRRRACGRPAGAIASSRSLQRSRVGQGSPWASNLGFNMATPMTAHFNREAPLRRRPADLPLRAPAESAGYVLGDLVQPARHAVALHARVVRGPLRTWSSTTTWRAPAWWLGPHSGRQRSPRAPERFRLRAARRTTWTPDRG